MSRSGHSPATLAKCLGCGHEACINGALEDGIFKCDECGVRMFYGQRVIITPHLDDPERPKVLIRLQQTGAEDVEMRIDARDTKFVASVANHLLSLVTY